MTICGVERRRIFADDRDRERFLEQLAVAVEDCGVRLYLFCLMTNHVHLLVETPRGNLSRFMLKLQTAYTVYFNLRHRRAGHLMQGRYGATPVQGDEYLLKLSRYIHLNPVFVGPFRHEPLEGRLERLRHYAWSSYRGYAGLEKPLEFVDEGPLLAQMEREGGAARRAYATFVEAGLAETDAEWQAVMKKAAWGIGDEELRATIRDRHREQTERARCPEDVSYRRIAVRVDPDAILKAVAAEYGLQAADLQCRQYGCEARAVAALLLIREAGLTQREVARRLGMGTGSAVCHRIALIKSCLPADNNLAARLERIQGKSNPKARAP